MNNFQFSLIMNDTISRARAGTFQTPHGVIDTPVFMPVGTQATVKSLSPAELEQCGCRITLANTYHLHLRPGDALVKEAGGLHRFESWNGALLTDSGGFQVFSLRDISVIKDEGVWFQSHIDGSKRFFSPETVMEIQHNLGADIIMAFDECPPSNAEQTIIEKAVDRTIEWAKRCAGKHESIPAHFGYPQALFGIVQGGVIKPLRQKCAEQLVAMDMPGYAIGGLAVGESIEDMYDIVSFTTSHLPQQKPRYLMGVGMPQNILECIDRGIDMFDCVLPTRNGRNGSVFTWNGKINIRNSCHTNDFTNPLDSTCGCYTCRNFSRSYLRHLFMAGEILAIRLLTLHNIYFYMELVRTAREKILGGCFSEWKRETIRKMAGDDGDVS